MNGESSIFLNEKPVQALIKIRRTREDIYCSVVARKIDSTYAHTVKIIQELEDEGYLTSEKKGRRKILELTEKGQDMAELFDRIVKSTHPEASYYPVQA